MTDSPFLALAERHDLDYAEGIVRDPARGSLLPSGEISDLAGGELPGGCRGIVARLRRTGHGEDAAPVESTVVVTRIPESLGFARFITCQESGFRGVVARAIGAGGLGWIREYSFESIEFNRRYRVTMLRTGKEIRLRELFSPVFLDWMAETAPDGLYFDLISGVLTVTYASDLAREVGDVERVCELASHIAERIRSEALEGPLGDDRHPQAGEAAAAGEAMLDERLEREGIDPSAADVASALERRKKGFLGRLFGSGRNTEATMLALAAVLRSYAGREGLEPDYPDTFNELIPALDHFPLAIMRISALQGRLPASGARGALVALLDLSGLGSDDARSWPAVEIESGAVDGSFVHVLPAGEGPARSPFGGFSLALRGARRESDRTSRARERTETLADSLNGQFEVVAERRGRAAPVGTRAREWLAGGGGGGMVLEGGRWTLLGSARPVLEWSHDGLDQLCASTAPVIAEVGRKSRRAGG